MVNVDAYGGDTTLGMYGAQIDLLIKTESRRLFGHLREYVAKLVNFPSFLCYLS